MSDDEKPAGPPYFAPEVCTFPVFTWGAPVGGGMEDVVIRQCGLKPEFRLLARNPVVNRVGWDALCLTHRTLVVAEAKRGYSGLDILKIVEV